jgi:putative DNA primase/helicase
MTAPGGPESGPATTPSGLIILGRLHAVGRRGSGCEAACPAHGDRNSSLPITVGDRGQLLLHDFAGCAVEDTLRAVGPDVRDLHPDGGRLRAEIIAAYDCRDQASAPLHRTVRYRSKDFRQRRPDGPGGWTWNLQGVARVLCRLPELLAADPAPPRRVVEGEEDVDRLAGLGLVATCNAGAAGRWRAEDAAALRGRHVVILPDDDRPGLEHAQRVAESLAGVAASVKVIDPGDLFALGDTADVSDRLDAEHAAAELPAALAGGPGRRP